jgi:hypothetical protein
MFQVCLQLTGLVTDTTTILAAFALARLLTAVAGDPRWDRRRRGGIGGTVGGPEYRPGAGRRRVLLFTISTHLLEIPFGVFAWLIWLTGGDRTHPDATGAALTLTLGTGSASGARNGRSQN